MMNQRNLRRNHHFVTYSRKEPTFLLSARLILIKYQ
jgi:hypothetical protein